MTTIIFILLKDCKQVQLFVIHLFHVYNSEVSQISPVDIIAVIITALLCIQPSNNMFLKNYWMA